MNTSRIIVLCVAILALVASIVFFIDFYLEQTYSNTWYVALSFAMLLASIIMFFLVISWNYKNFGF